MKHYNMALVDARDRIILPFELMEAFNLDADSEFIVSADLKSGTILLKHTKRACVFCGVDDLQVKFMDFDICSACIGMLKEV